MKKTIARKEVQRMSRLIDANKLILHLNDYALVESPSDNESTEERRISEMVYKVIQNCIKAVEEQPTAFDIEKVVEEFEEAKFPITDLKQGVVINGVQQTDDAVLYDRAIDIVRKGGVE